MTILINLYSPREVKNFLYTPLYELLKKDTKKNFILLTNFSEKIGFKKKFETKNIKIKKPAQINNLKKTLYRLTLDRLYEYKSLAPQTCPDQTVFFNRMKQFQKKKYILGVLNFWISKLIPNQLLRKFEKWIFYNPEYNKLKVDTVLLTAYHSFEELQLLFSIQYKKVYFFTDGWDAFTKQTFYTKKPDKTFVWNQNMLESAQKNCGLKNIIITGNPAIDELKEYVSQNPQKMNDKKIKIGFFCNNKNIYNEFEILQKLHNYLEDKNHIQLHVRLSPSDNYEETKEKYISTFPKFIIHEINQSNWLESKKSHSKYFDESYLKFLNICSYFIVNGPSTVLLDIVALNKKTLLCHLADERKGLWNWNESEKREVIKDLLKSDNVISISNFSNLFDNLNKLTANYPKNNLKVKSSVSKKLYKELINNS